MRFEKIFEDLEGRFAHHEQEEMRAVSEDLARAERAQLALTDRLRAVGDRTITVHLGPALRWTGTVSDLGQDWLALRDAASGARIVVPLSAIALVEGMSDRARPSEDSLVSALGLGSVLRGIARDRHVVHLETTAGRLTGRIAAVGADVLDLQQVPTGEVALGGANSPRLTVVWSALLAVVPA